MTEGDSQMAEAWLARVLESYRLRRARRSLGVLLAPSEDARMQAWREVGKSFFDDSVLGRFSRAKWPIASDWDPVYYSPPRPATAEEVAAALSEPVERVLEID